MSGADETENVRQAVEIAELENNTKLKNLAIITFTERESNGRILEALNTREGFFVLRLKPSLLTAIDILTNKKKEK